MSKHKILVISLGALFVVAVGFFVRTVTISYYTKSMPEVSGDTVPKTREDEVQQILTSAEGDRLQNLQGRLLDFFVSPGMDVLMKKVQQGLDNGTYGINECHRIMHVLGHGAYRTGDADFARMARADSFVCGHGYQHGVEAQIALTSHNAVGDLHAFCAALQNVRPGTTCYHGVGHEEMQTIQKIQPSLEFCDKILPNSPVADMTDCYKGVFSQYAFLIAGVDGDTGTPFPGGAKISLPTAHPLEFCASFKVLYQGACASQLSRLLYDTHRDGAFAQCLQKKFSSLLQENCVSIIAAVAAQQAFARKELIRMPNVIQTSTTAVQRQYLQGTLGEYWALKNSGVAVEMAEFCREFVKAELFDTCKKATGTI